MRIRKIVRILVYRSFFRFLPQGSAIWLNVPKKGVFDVLIKGYFFGNARNVIFGMEQAQGVVNILQEVVFRILTLLAVNRQKNRSSLFQNFLVGP